MNPYIALPRVPIVGGRQDFVLERCKGKRVLHIGCADSPLTRERFYAGELLHSKLAKVAAELWGVDIDTDAISFLRTQGFNNNLVVGDASTLDKIPELQGQCFDIIVASEVIEHLMNPGLFLEAVKNLMIPNSTELIVTVPNAFRISTLLLLLRGVEYVHPDHNYWFSYATVTKLLKKAGFEIKEVYVYSFQSAKILPYSISKFFKKTSTSLVQHPKVRSSPSNVRMRVIGYLKSIPRRLLVRFVYNRTPFWADGIIVVVVRPEI